MLAKRLCLVLAFVGFSSYITAQESFSGSSGEFLISTSKKMRHSFIYKGIKVRTPSALYAVRAYFPDEDPEYVVEKYDLEFNCLAETKGTILLNKVKGQDENFKFFELCAKGSELVLLSEFQDVEKGQAKIILQEISSESLDKIGDAQTLIEIKHRKKKDVDPGTFEYRQSPDGNINAVLFRYPGVFPKQQIVAHVYDSNWNLLYSNTQFLGKRIDFFEFLDWHITDSAEVHVLAKEYLKFGPDESYRDQINYTLNHYQFNEPMRPIKSNVDIESNYLVSVSSRFASDGNLIIAAAVANESQGYPSKLMCIRFSPNDRAIISKSFIPIPEDSIKRELKNGGSEYRFFSKPEILFNPDGSFWVLTERHAVKTNVHRTEDYRVDYTTKWYHNYGVLVAIFNSQGEGEWFRSIHKRQISKGYHKSNSYFAFTGDSSLHMMYLTMDPDVIISRRPKLRLVNHTTLRRTGEYSNEYLWNLKETEVIPYFKDAFQLKNGFFCAPLRLSSGERAYLYQNLD